MIEYLNQFLYHKIRNVINRSWNETWFYSWIGNLFKKRSITWIKNWSLIWKVLYTLPAHEGSLPKTTLMISNLSACWEREVLYAFGTILQTVLYVNSLWGVGVEQIKRSCGQYWVEWWMSTWWMKKMCYSLLTFFGGLEYFILKK